MKIGFIGVGNIGAPIARQLLQAGHALVVHDIRPEAANSLLAAGGVWSSSPAALAADCEVVATCLRCRLALGKRSAVACDHCRQFGARAVRGVHQRRGNRQNA